MPHAESNAQRLNGIQMGALVVAGLGIVLSIFGVASDLDHFFHLYLTSFVFWVELSLGCFAVMMLSIIIDADWTYAIQRMAAAGTRTIPLMAVLFIPLLFGLGQVYPWAGEAAGELQITEAYLNTGLFLIRAVIYFAIWISLGFVISQLLYEYDETQDPALYRRAKYWSIVGMIVFFLTATFAAFDWSMSVEPEWFSSVYGWLSISRSALSVFSLFVLVMLVVGTAEPFLRYFTTGVRVAYSQLLLVSLAVWAYLSFMQYIIYWSGNLPKKVVYYEMRTGGGWEGITFLLVLFHAVALLLLLLPGFKRVPQVLLAIAGTLFVLRFTDAYWTVMPQTMETFVIYVFDLALPLAFGGGWVAFFVYWLKRQRFFPSVEPADLRAIGQEERDEGEEDAYETA